MKIIHYNCVKIGGRRTPQYAIAIGRHGFSCLFCGAKLEFISKMRKI